MDGLDLGVSDGTRTRDILDHNQVLYQLSYTHHALARPAALTMVAGRAPVTDRVSVRSPTGPLPALPPSWVRARERTRCAGSRPVRGWTL
jgi:hypothetical protein